MEQAEVSDMFNLTLKKMQAKLLKNSTDQAKMATKLKLKSTQRRMIEKEPEKSNSQIFL
jgi:hypothetical protein